MIILDTGHVNITVTLCAYITLAANHLATKTSEDPLESKLRHVGNKRVMGDGR